MNKAGQYTQARELHEQPESMRDLLETFGHDPDKFDIDGPVRVSHRELADGRTVSTYSYRLLDRPETLDLDELIKAAKRSKSKPPAKADGLVLPHWFVFQAGDLQIGKRSSEGSTDEIISLYVDSVARAIDEFKALKRHGVAGIQISLPGDCIEGVVSQGGKNVWLTQETITEQTRILRRLMLLTVDAFAPLADQVFLDAVGGNHDEAQRGWNTYPGDNWATECAIAVGDALKMNEPAYGHVEVRVPDKWSGHMTVPVGDTEVTIVHGHQWRPGKGMHWWQEQTFGGHDPGRAKLLQNGHWHEMALERNGDRTRVQSPTFDCGSDWYRELHGVGNTRGGLSYLLRSGEVSRLSLV